MADRPATEPLDEKRLGGLIERAIREHQRELADAGRPRLMPDGWTIARRVLSYSADTPTEPSLSPPAATPADEEANR